MESNEDSKSSKEGGKKMKDHKNDFDEFREEFRNALMRLKPDEMKITFRQVTKANRGTLHGVIPEMPGADTAPTFYMEDIYKSFHDGLSVEGLAQEIITYAAANNYHIPIGFNILNYKEVKSHLALAAIGADGNREYLKAMVHETIEDIALIPIIFTEGQDGTGCVKVPSSILEKWGVTAETVLEDAKENAPRVLPPKAVWLSPQMLVVSVKQLVYGAAVAFYPGFLSRLRERLGTDFYILPSSVNEVIVIPEGFGPSAEELGEIVRTVNREEVSADEILTDSVYHFGQDGFRIVSKMFEMGEMA